MSEAEKTIQPDFDHTSLPFLRIAQEALVHYDFQCSQIVFLQHNSGVAFRLDCTEKERYLLKLHLSVNEESDSPFDAINSRMQWLADLHAKTGIPVQVPIRNQQNQWITPIYDHLRNEWVSCTVQRWVDGDPPHGDFTGNQLARLGRLMAQLHTYSSQSPDFHLTIPSYSSADLMESIQTLHQSVEFGLLSEAEFSHIEPVKDAILAFLGNIGNEPRYWGPIHGDIHHDNVLIDQDDIRIIDFDNLFRAPYVYDLGVTLYHIEYQGIEARQAFLEGYQQKDMLSILPTNWVETCMAWAAISNLAFQIPIPQQRAGQLLKKNLKHFIYAFCMKHEH